jgi:hypothetical protein
MAAIDYSKAFDSIDRKALIATMKKYECDRMCIEVVSRLYIFFFNSNFVDLREGSHLILFP